MFNSKGRRILSRAVYATDAFFQRQFYKRCYKRHLRDCETFCLVISGPRSGTSFITALLSLHPEIALTNELFFLCYISGDLNYYNKSPSKRYAVRMSGKEALGYLAHTAYLAKSGQGSGSYSDIVPPSLGDSDNLQFKVVGDKFFSWSMDQEAADTPGNWLYAAKEIRHVWGLSPCVISPIRNPYDVISTTCLRFAERCFGELPPRRQPLGHPLSVGAPSKGGLDESFETLATLDVVNYESALKRCISAYKKRVDNIGKLESLGLFPHQYFRYEELVSDPPKVMRALTEFVGVDCPQSYLESVALAVRPPRKTRAFLEQFWTQENKELVQELIERHHFINSYSYDD